MEDVLGQLDWLTAELEAQKPFLTRIPEVQLTARPLAEKPSLLGLYEAMAERERGYLAQLDISGEEEIPESIGDVLAALIALRNTLLATLGALSETAWEQRLPTATEGTLLEWAYQITLNDGEALRAIAERIHESQLRLGGRPDGP